MAAEVLTLLIGQCGLSVGKSFLNLISEEHKKALRDPNWNWEDRSVEDLYIFFQKRDNKPVPRVFLIDPDPRTVGDLLKEWKLPDDYFQSGTGGVGNNWKRGYNWAERVSKNIKSRLEPLGADAGNFIMFHGLGGGTGSGAGSYVFEHLNEWFPHKQFYKIAFSVLPGRSSPSAAWPFNTIFTLNYLREHAHAIVLFDNEAMRNTLRHLTGRIIAGYEQLNQLISRIVSNITASTRFPGQGQNIDFGNIIIGLTPRKDMKIVSPNIYPVVEENESVDKSCADMVIDALDNEHKIVKGNIEKFVMTAMYFIPNGDFHYDEVIAAVERLESKYKPISLHVPWGVGDVRVGPRRVVVVLINSCAIASRLREIYDRAEYYRKIDFYLDHYIDEGMTKEEIDEHIGKFKEMIDSIEKFNEKFTKE